MIVTSTDDCCRYVCYKGLSTVHIFCVSTSTKHDLLMLRMRPMMLVASMHACPDCLQAWLCTWCFMCYCAHSCWHLSRHRTTPSCFEMYKLISMISKTLHIGTHSTATVEAASQCVSPKYCNTCSLQYKKFIKFAGHRSDCTIANAAHLGITRLVTAQHTCAFACCSIFLHFSQFQASYQLVAS